MLADTLHAPLEDREVAFDRVGMDRATAPLAGSVPHECVIGEFAT